ncbi:hypothetical protein [Streptomyces mirabilis]|uniref:hypothetical protein n=1 Tax=Streptomyces mirabilis TaxID=68239 RepID=UPI00367CE7BF
MTSHVEQQIQARIARVRAEQERKRQQRAELAAARTAGLARRHAQKLRNLRGAADHAGPANRGDTATIATPEGPMPAALRPAVCPSCRQQRAARLITTVVVSGTAHDVVRCLEKACELMWLVRAERPRTAPAAA